MNDKKTILQILPNLESGGVERGTLEIANELVDNGYTSIVVSNGGRLVAKLIAKNTIHIKLPVHSKNPAQIIANIFSLNKIIKEYKVDIIHARSRAPAWSGYLAAKISKIKFMTTFHSTYSFNSTIKQYYNSVMVKGCVTIANSNFIKNHIQQNYTKYIEKTVIKKVDRGFDNSSFSPINIDKEKLSMLKKEWDIKKDDFVILLPGRMVRRKGHLLLLQGLIKLKSSVNYKVILLGANPDGSNYNNMVINFIKENGLEDKVFIKQSTDDMVTAYGLVNLVVVPSIVPEAFGRVTVESQAMKKMVLAAAHGASCDLIEHKETGFLFDADDAFSLAKNLNEILLLTNKQYQVITEKAQKIAIEKYTIKRMCNKTLAIYKELLQS